MFWVTYGASLVNDLTRYNQFLALNVSLAGVFSWGTISPIMWWFRLNSAEFLTECQHFLFHELSQAHCMRPLFWAHEGEEELQSHFLLCWGRKDAWWTQGAHWYSVRNNSVVVLLPCVGVTVEAPVVYQFVSPSQSPWEVQIGWLCYQEHTAVALLDFLTVCTPLSLQMLFIFWPW